MNIPRSVLFVFLCVRHWKESPLTLFYIVPALTPCTEYLINVIWKWQQKQCWRLKHISKDNKVWKSLTVKPLLWCVYIGCVSPEVCNTHHRESLLYLFFFAAFNHAWCQVGNFYSQRNFQLTCKVLNKVLSVILSWTSLFWEVGSAVWVTVLHLPSEWVYYKRF